MNRWPHQSFAVRQISEAVAMGDSRILLTSPTGGGKSLVACDIIDLFAGQNWFAILYTNRRMLLEQILGVVGRHGIDVGVRASGHPTNLHAPVQVSSVPTERKRTLTEEAKWDIHGIGRKCIALFDEAHLNSSGSALELMDRHVAAGHVVLGITATPIDLGHAFTKLIVAGTNSELRGCGALVHAEHFGPDEPDMRDFRKSQAKLASGDDLSERENVKAMMTPGIFGRVHSWYRVLNPTQKPSILFAPGVKESLWFAEQFTKKGIPAAHIDGDSIWIAGEDYSSSPKARLDLMEASKCGDIKVLCNRFVLREGIDAPWMEHGIFATMFGSLQSYIQSGGRLLRASAITGKTFAVIQDHGGSWHRHGSLNADRIWDITQTSREISGVRAEKLREKELSEPARCPQCAKIVEHRICRNCGCEMPWQRSRPVIGTDGTPKQMVGDIFRPRLVNNETWGPEDWVRCYYRARNAKMTFEQAKAVFAMEHNWTYPGPDWPLMPLEHKDSYRRVCDVPAERLRPRDRKVPETVINSPGDLFGDA